MINCDKMAEMLRKRAKQLREDADTLPAHIPAARNLREEADRLEEEAKEAERLAKEGF